MKKLQITFNFKDIELKEKTSIKIKNIKAKTGEKYHSKILETAMDLYHKKLKGD